MQFGVVFFSFKRSQLPLCTTNPNPANGACYWWETQHVGWRVAQTSCYENGGTLATVDSEETRDFLESELLGTS